MEISLKVNHLNLNTIHIWHKAPTIIACNMFYYWYNAKHYLPSIMIHNGIATNSFTLT